MPRLIAIDLGSHSVKATVWQGTARRFQLEGRHAHAVPQDGLATPGLDVRLLALDALLEQHPEWKHGNPTWAVTWPGEQASLHRIELPFTDRAQVERTLPFAIEAEVPFDLDDMVLGWRVLSQTDGTKALVCLARRDRVAHLIEELSGRGMDPRHVFVDADLLGHWALRDRTVAMVDIGHAHTLVAVAREGIVHWSRAINVGGRDFVRAVQQVEGGTWEESTDRLLGGMIGPADAWAQLSPKAREALDGPIGLLLAEIRSTLIAAEDALGVETDEVRLSGGASRLHPLADFLHQDLGVPVGMAADLDGDPVPPEFAVSDALAARLAGLTRGVEIDLRVGDLEYRGGLDVVRTAFLYGGPLFAFVLAGSLIMFAVQFVSLGSEQAEVEQRVKDVVIETLPQVDPAAVRDGTTALAIMRENTKDAVARAAVLDRTGQVPPTMQKLHDLTQAFPPPAEVTVDVSELTVTPANITFSAETDGYASAAAVEESLRGSARFSAASKGNEKKVRDKVTFTVNIPLAGGPAVDDEEG